jgi:hypothetical protein
MLSDSLELTYPTSPFSNTYTSTYLRALSISREHDQFLNRNIRTENERNCDLQPLKRMRHPGWETCVHDQYT